MVNKHNNTGAADYLSKLGTLVRQTMHISGKVEHSIAEEIRYLENYLDMEQTRFSENFTYHIKNNTGSNTLNIPALVIQPFAENAIRHGLRPKKGNHRMLDISFNLENGFLSCIIEDNGIGRNAAREQQSHNPTLHQSQGIELSASRLNLASKLTGGETKVEIQDKYDAGKNPTGTKVIIHIKQPS
jgi:sensor histidine kinase YesM